MSHAPTIMAESVNAVDLPGVIQSLTAEGHNPQLRPRGPIATQGSTGIIHARCAMFNPEEHTFRDMYGTAIKTYAPGETILVVGEDKRCHYWPLTYPKGRPLTFRVFV